MAHSGRKGENPDESGRPRSNFRLFLKMMTEDRYKGLLFGDLSGLTIRDGTTLDHLAVIMGEPALQGRMVNGSDYPLPWRIVPQSHTGASTQGIHLEGGTGGPGRDLRLQPLVVRFRRQADHPAPQEARAPPPGNHVRRHRCPPALSATAARHGLQAVPERPGKMEKIQWIRSTRRDHSRRQIRRRRIPGSRRRMTSPYTTFDNSSCPTIGHHNRNALLLHDPSPMHEARRRPIRRNPRYLHRVRRVTDDSDSNNPSRRSLALAPQDEENRILNPHAEEARSAVSKHLAPTILRDARLRSLLRMRRIAFLTLMLRRRGAPSRSIWHQQSFETLACARSSG